MSLNSGTTFPCPYCAAENLLATDISGGRRQEFVVDCEVCCAPVAVRLAFGGSGEVLSVDARRENE